MKAFLSYVLFSFALSSCYAMDSGAWDCSNPFALLALEDEDDVVVPVVPAEEKPQLSLFDLIQGRGFKALDGLRDAFAQGYDVNAQSREGRNTILHAALLLPSLECAYYIVREKRAEINTLLQNRDHLTVLDLAYKRLAGMTLSVKLGRDAHGFHYSVVRYHGNMLKDHVRCYDIQEHNIACGKEGVDLYTFSYGGDTYCFDVHPLRSVIIASRVLKQVFQLNGTWRGWVDMVYKLNQRGRVRLLIDMIQMLGGDEIGFAQFLFKGKVG